MFNDFVHLNIKCYDGILSVNYRNPVIADESHLRHLLCDCLLQCDNKSKFTMEYVEDHLLYWGEGEISVPDSVNIMDII